MTIYERAVVEAAKAWRTSRANLHHALPHREETAVLCGLTNDLSKAESALVAALKRLEG